MEGQTENIQSVATPMENTKFCVHCGAIIPKDAVLCTKCGRMVDPTQQVATPQVVINNSNANTNANINTNVNANGVMRKLCNKWVALLLAIFLGYFGAHKFYEGKIGMGLIYLFTCGLFGVGVIVDIIIILFKPTNYYV